MCFPTHNGQVNPTKIHVKGQKWLKLEKQNTRQIGPKFESRDPLNMEDFWAKFYPKNPLFAPSTFGHNPNL